MQSAENKEKSWERGQRVEANICCNAVFKTSQGAR